MSLKFSDSFSILDVGLGHLTDELSVCPDC